LFTENNLKNKFIIDIDFIRVK